MILALLPNPSKMRLGFLDLPAEVRNQIYQLATRSDRMTEVGLTLEFTHSHAKQTMPYWRVTQLSRQIRAEALPIVFRENHVTICSHWLEKKYPVPILDQKVVKDIEFGLHFMRATKEFHHHIRSLRVWVHGAFSRNEQTGELEPFYLPMQINADPEKKTFTVSSWMYVLGWNSQIKLLHLLCDYVEKGAETHNGVPNYLAVVDNEVVEKTRLGWTDKESKGRYWLQDPTTERLLTAW